MKYGFSSYNSYDPLKAVLIGSAYPVDFFADHPDTKVADALCKVNDETREDLDNLKKVAVRWSRGERGRKSLIDVATKLEACLEEGPLGTAEQ